jgi:hypothetical protein
VHLTADQIAYMRGKSWDTSAPDSDGVQHGTCVQEPRLTFTVRSGLPNDQPEERTWFVDGEPVRDLGAAIAMLTPR